MGRAWVKRVSAPPLGLVARGVRATGVPDEWPSPALRGGIQNPAYRPSGAFPKSLPIPSQSGQPAGAHEPMPPAGGGPLMATHGASWRLVAEVVPFRPPAAIFPYRPMVALFCSHAARSDGSAWDGMGALRRHPQGGARPCSPASRSLPGFPAAIPRMCTAPSTFSPD